MTEEAMTPTDVERALDEIAAMGLVPILRRAEVPLAELRPPAEHADKPWHWLRCAVDGALYPIRWNQDGTHCWTGCLPPGFPVSCSYVGPAEWRPNQDRYTADVEDLCRRQHARIIYLVGEVARLNRMLGDDVSAAVRLSAYLEKLANPPVLIGPSVAGVPDTSAPSDTSLSGMTRTELEREHARCVADGFWAEAKQTPEGKEYFGQPLWWNSDGLAAMDTAPSESEPSDLAAMGGIIPPEADPMAGMTMDELARGLADAQGGGWADEAKRFEVEIKARADRAWQATGTMQGEGTSE